MILSKINFRGVEGYVIEARHKGEVREDLFHYHLRHGDDGEIITIEDCVAINYWGFICFKESIDHLLDKWREDKLGSDLTEEEQSEIWYTVNEAPYGEIEYANI